MPPASAPAPNALPDLAALIAQAWGRPVGGDDRVAVAVSGGPDSLALLSLAVEAFAGRATAITVDHRLRAGSMAEAASVAAQCAARGIAHVTLVRDGPGFAANLQAQARTARYALMAEWCAANAHGLLLTAHHADDQAETLLMRLNRASGSAGLAGIRAARAVCAGVWLVRPLLGQRKAELAAIAAAAGWDIIHDPSNDDPRHDRSHARRATVASGLDVLALARAAQHLAADAAALDWAANVAWDGRVVAAGGELQLDLGGLPSALVHRVLARAIAMLGSGPPRGGDVARLAARLSAGQKSTLAGVAARPGKIWHLRPAMGHQGATNGHQNPRNGHKTS